MAGRDKIAILSTFMEFIPGYSLTGIVADQAAMLSKYGWEVHLFVNSAYHGEKFSDNVILEKKIPFSHLVDYRKEADLSTTHADIAIATAEMLVNELQDYNFVFTHDFVFTGWNLPYGIGCREAGKRLPNVRWFHWIHSVPTAGFDWWRIKAFGSHHKIIYPNKIDAIRVAEQYHGVPSDVLTIPHIKDLRTWFEFGPETLKFMDAYPKVMSSEIVQVYPASVDRLTAKRLDVVIDIFSKLKKGGKSVCLVVADQWATGRQQKEDVNKYKKIANYMGLENGTELIFTSDWETPKYDVGVPRRMLRELMMCMNLFIFPTREESFGLVLPEASLSSGCLCVLNKSLTMQMEVSGFTTLYFDFGSYHTDHRVPDPETYHKDIAFLILERIKANESILIRTHMRRKNNMDYLYNSYYAPMMAGSAVW